MVTATPTGILRLFDRFDLIALEGAIGPLVRLVGAAALAVTGGGLGDFLVVWFAANVAGGTLFLAFAFWELNRHKLLDGMGWSLRGLAKPHAGIWRFVWTTNLNTGLGLATNHFGVIAVGWILGPADAGALRVARQFAEALAKPAKLLAPVIYPELAKLSAQGKGDVLTRLVRRSILTAGALGLVVLSVVVVAGKLLLQLTVGPEFLSAYGVMILLCLAAVISITAFPLEPLLITSGRPGTVLRVRLLATFIYVPLLLLLLTLMGLLGAGTAAVFYAALLFAGFHISAAPWLRHRPS
jgi:O-antigen/teichoic acid export membrane protein